MVVGGIDPDIVTNGQSGDENIVPLRIAPNSTCNLQQLAPFPISEKPNQPNPGQ
jgi:hypothetical protein